MTDNEIIKAWEKVLNNSDEPIGEHWMVFVTTQMAKETFDMLNRQKAEIERLKENNQKLYEEMAERQKEEVAIAKRMGKSEAIKEFADRLKEKSFKPLGTWFNEKVVTEQRIDNLLKEMVGDDNA